MILTIRLVCNECKSITQLGWDKIGSETISAVEKAFSGGCKCINCKAGTMMVLKAIATQEGKP